MIANTFIKRPVTAIVISIVLVITGTICILNLPVDQYPEITPPIVQVNGQFTGADAETVEQTMATPIEAQVNGTPGMEYMQSTGPMRSVTRRMRFSGGEWISFLTCVCRESPFLLFYNCQTFLDADLGELSPCIPDLTGIRPMRVPFLVACGIARNPHPCVSLLRNLFGCSLLKERGEPPLFC